MQNEPSLPRKLVAEFLGTGLLTLIGAGSVTATLTLEAGSTAPFSQADLQDPFPLQTEAIENLEDLRTLLVTVSVVIPAEPFERVGVIILQSTDEGLAAGMLLPKVVDLRFGHRFT